MMPFSIFWFLCMLVNLNRYSYFMDLIKESELFPNKMYNQTIGCNNNIQFNYHKTTERRTIVVLSFLYKLICTN